MAIQLSERDMMIFKFIEYTPYTRLPQWVNILGNYSDQSIIETKSEL